MTFQNNTSQCQGWTFSISKISFFKMLISDFCHVTFTFISWLSPWQPCLIHCSVPVCVNMLSLMTCCHLILLHVRFLPFKTFKLRNNLWETHCRLDLLIFMTEGLIHFFRQDFQHVWGQNSFVPQEEVACYLMSASLQLTALRCGNLQTELSRAMSHTGKILLCIIYSLAQYYALAFFTFTGLINMIHDFDIGVSLLCDC